MCAYYYRPEESLINGLVNGILGAVEGFIVSVFLGLITRIEIIAGFDIYSLIALSVIVPTIYLLIRIFVAFVYMTRLSTMVYYVTFVITYFVVNLYLGDYLSAFLVFIAVILSLLLRVELEKESPIL